LNDPLATSAEEWPSSWLVRAASAGAVAHAVSFPLLQLNLLAAVPELTGDMVAATAATAVYLPLHLRHVMYGLRGTRAPAAAWTLLAMAVVIVGALPLVGIFWLGNFSALAGSVLIVAPAPWSAIGFIGLIAVIAPLAVMLSADAGLAALNVYTVAWQALSLFVIVWLVVAVRRLHEARSTLADEAIAQEQVRVDDEVRRTVGTALEAITTRGDAACRLVGVGRAEPELRALVELSHRTLTDVRRMVRGYQRASLRTELETAADLLTASGMEVRLVLPPSVSAEAVGDAQRSQLRAAVAQMLADDSIHSCTIIVRRRNGQVTLDFDTAAHADLSEVLA
jgi:two-component system sensor histidine kinase DesK